MGQLFTVMLEHGRGEHKTHKRLSGLTESQVTKCLETHTRSNGYAALVYPEDDNQHHIPGLMREDWASGARTSIGVRHDGR